MDSLELRTLGRLLVISVIDTRSFNYPIFLYFIK